MHPIACDGMWTFSGWIFGQGTTHCCAVRARGSGPTVHGLMGMPRPDVAAAYPAEPQAVFSGFRIDLSGLNNHPIRLEWMDDAGHWHEFWREPDAGRVHRPRRSARPLLPTRRLPALHAAVVAETTGQAWRKAWRRAHELVEDYASQPTPAPACPALLVHLDEPSGELHAGRSLAFSGWIFSRQMPVKRVFAQLEPGGLVHLVFPKPRPDVAAAYASPPAPVMCGFSGMILLPAKSATWLYFRLYAETADGSVALAVSRRFLLQSPPVEPAGNARAALLLGAHALTGAYQPQSWRHWLQELQPHRRVAVSAKPPVKSPLTSGQPKGGKLPPAMTQGMELQKDDPLISILVPVFNTPENYLCEMIASVQAQLYPRWELCLADDASTAPHVRPLLAEFARADPRIRPVYRPENGHIARATNTALDCAQGEFVALLDHDDLLAPEVLLRVVDTIRAHAGVQFLYTDRDKIDDCGRHFDLEQRGAWNPAMAITHNYLHQLTVIRRDLVQRAGAFRPEYFGSQDLDLYLRCHELLEPGQIVHVPVTGYHWRAHAGSTASRGDQKDYMFDSARRGIEEALRRRGLRAKPWLPEFGLIYGMNLHQLSWDSGLLRENPVSVVLAVTSPGKDAWRRTVATLNRTVPADSVQVIIVTAGEFSCGLPSSEVIKVEFVVAPPGTCLAGLYNLGAARARNPLLLLLDASVRPSTSGWLEDLAGWLSVPGVAAVGPKLVAANGLLASAAWTIDPETSLPQPLCAGDPVEDLTPPFLSHAARDVLLLDSSCVLTHTAVFRELGGYESRDLHARYFAADYCLRLQDRGRRVVFSPQAVLDTNMEAGTDLPATGDEDAVFRQRHPHCTDPWIHSTTPLFCPPAPSQPETPRNDWMPRGTVEFSGGWFFLEQPRPGMELTAGRQVLSGWCLAKSAASIVELKVTHGAQTRLATFGHPRPDLALAVGDRGIFFPTGFDLELHLSAGSTRMDFHALVAGAGWQPVTEIELTITPGHGVPAPKLPEILRISGLVECLERLWEQPTPKGSMEERAAALARDFPWQDKVRYPALPFHGYFDEPTGNLRTVYNGTEIHGWLFHETNAIRRVVASFDLSCWLELSHGSASPGIRKQFAQFPNSARCEVAGYVTVPHGRPQPLCLHLWAELEDGSWHLVYLRRCRVLAPLATESSRLHQVRTPELILAAFAVRLAFYRCGVPAPGWGKLWSIVRQLRHRFAFREPLEVIPVSPASITGIPARPHVLLVTHNLNLEGAPLFLLELAHYLQRQVKAGLTVVSPTDGPLRGEFEQLGIGVRLVNRDPLWAARTTEEVQISLAQLVRELRAHEASIVIANTIESFWAVHAAHEARRPSVFYVHEPGVIGLHYLETQAPAAQQQAATTLTQASVVSFPSTSTLAYYRRFCVDANCRIQPGWTDLSGIVPAHSTPRRARLRARLGFAPDERLVINVGTLCPRKGQSFFVSAIELLWRMRPALAGQCRFLMIGAYDNGYGEMLAGHIARLGRTNIHFVPPTPHIEEYFTAADLFVLSSFEEGFPRALLEAMGFGLPIISTAIHAIPEIARAGKEALLVPPGDPQALAAAMQLLLADEELALRLGRKARERVESNFTAERILPQHLATIRELAVDLEEAAHLESYGQTSEAPDYRSGTSPGKNLSLPTTSRSRTWP